MLPVAIEGDLIWFHLPTATQDVRLVSRSWIPAQLLSASTDTRRLGVCVHQLLLDGRTLALDDPRLSEGWNQLEGSAAGPQRWTRGCAFLPPGVRTLGVQLKGFAVYWLNPSPILEASGAASGSDLALVHGGGGG